ncbi:MAG: arsenate reductase (glutaredoxin), partial [Candidatus Dadabacteria bacterium]|nr:arsenate reductase (glutaredoxin) [Candidatus Dadabacteria bacterium]
MMSMTLYHNPRCSKSRATLELLESRGFQPEIIEYLKTPPNSETLKEILKLLGLTPREIMRNKETAFKEAGLDNENLSDDEIIAAMIEHPILIERPILVANGKAAIGRPPENVL